MKGFTIAGLIVSAFAEVSQHGGDVGIPLKTIIGDIPELPKTEFTGWLHTSKLNDAAKRSRVGRSQKFFETRTREVCDFPLEIVILQDLTDSFSDNIQEMKNVQLKQMINGLKATHPNSRFAMVSFQDKPLFALGNRDDACWGFHGDFTTDVEPIYDAYANVQSYGGADAPENQFGALLAAMESEKLSWSNINSEFARLIVVVTDAGPHHADDGSKPEDGTVLKPWEGEFSDDRAEELCTKYHYPSRQQMYDQIVAHQTYVAALVFDGNWAEGWAANEWKTFNRFLAQPDGFVEPDAEDSSGFWAQLSKIIGEIEDAECGPTPSPPPPTPAPTTVAPTPAPTTVAPTATTAGMTDPPVTDPTTECQPTIITDAPCVPSEENCFCHPEVLIQLGHSPDSMNLVADDKVIVKK